MCALIHTHAQPFPVDSLVGVCVPQDPTHTNLTNLLRAEVTIQHSALLKYHLVCVCMCGVCL